MMHFCSYPGFRVQFTPTPYFHRGQPPSEKKNLSCPPPFLVMQQKPPQLWLIQLGFKILPRAAVCIISLLCINCENSKSVSYMLALIFYHFRRNLPKHWTAISDKRDHHNVTSMPLQGTKFLILSYFVKIHTQYIPISLPNTYLLHTFGLQKYIPFYQ